MTDPGLRLLGLIAARTARGEDRDSAKAAVMRENRDLVNDWHGAGGPVRETELVTYPGAELLQHAAALERTGVPRERAVHMTMAKFPALALAHHEGRPIERPQLPASGRRVQAHEMVPGRTYVHKLADISAGGGIFELGMAA